MAVPAHLDCWGPGNFKTLIFAIVFPFLVHMPSTVVRKLYSVFQETALATGNFLRKILLEIGGCHPCQKTWCGPCYTSRRDVNFQVKTLQDNVQGMESNPKEMDRLMLAWEDMYERKCAFNMGRDGDHKSRK